jgi:2-polyprenyl-6-methoxyphenol hydroxylase-like FAD-dependent oxidoreductase
LQIWFSANATIAQPEATRVPAVRNVLIIGAGISGLTAGIALRRRGIAVDIAEIRTDVVEQAGVGLSLQGNCIAALGKLGLAAACIQAGMATNYINIRRPDGVLIMHQPVLQTGGPAYPGTAGISRRTLHQILLAEAAATGVNVRLGTSFKSVDSLPERVRVELTDRSMATYDLLIGADGIHSKIRELLFPEVGPVYCGQAIWRAGVPRPDGSFTTELHLGGPYGVVGICPISSEDAYVYLIETAGESPRGERDGLGGQMLEKLKSYGGPLLSQAVSHLPLSKSVSLRGIDQLLVPAPWHKGRIVIIGDAAHANPPVLAQGAAMGIEDALVLAEVLSEDGENSSLGLEDRLLRFTARRLPRAGMVVKNSVQLCEWQVNHQATPQDVGRIMQETQITLSQPF